MRILLLLLCCILAGCSGNTRYELFNFSEKEIMILNEGAKERVKENDSIILIEIKYAVMNLDIGEKALCYSLIRINTGGYSEYMGWNESLIRFKLDSDNKIYVYNLLESEFDPTQHVGSQPPGYPLLPHACKK